MEFDRVKTAASASEFKIIGALAELEPYGQFSRWIEDHDILVYRLDGEVKAISNICPHFGGPVGYHQQKSGLFTCLWHNFQFSAKDGVCKNNAQLKLRPYTVKVEGESVLVRLVEKN